MGHGQDEYFKELALERTHERAYDKGFRESVIARKGERVRLDAMARIDGEIGILREFAAKYRVLHDNLMNTFREAGDPRDLMLGSHFHTEWREIEARITRLLVTFGELEKQEVT